MSVHCVIDVTDQTLLCLVCGAQTPLPLPLPITEVVKRVDAFAAQHRRCRPTRQGVAA